MEKNVLYHGSNVSVNHPRILTHGFYKDFGYGFYCTNIEKQAKRWALVKNNNHVVNRYTYMPNENLNVLKFEKMTEEWLDFVVDCRRLYSWDDYQGSFLGFGKV